MSPGALYLWSRLLATPAAATASDTGEPARGETCDLDGDGFEALGCGGEDCHDLDDTVYPGAPDAPDDGLDQDCDGYDGAVEQRWVSGGAGTCSAAPGAPALALLLAAFGLWRRRCEA